MSEERTLKQMYGDAEAMKRQLFALYEKHFELGEIPQEVNKRISDLLGTPKETMDFMFEGEKIFSDIEASGDTLSSSQFAAGANMAIQLPRIEAKIRAAENIVKPFALDPVGNIEQVMSAIEEEKLGISGYTPEDFQSFKSSPQMGEFVYSLSEVKANPAIAEDINDLVEGIEEADRRAGTKISKSRS